MTRALQDPSSHVEAASRPVCSFQNVIFDLGDVLFAWSPAKKLAISPQELRAILRSSVWFEYEKGQISQDECYSRAATAFGLKTEDVATAFQAAQESLRADPRMVGLIRDLKSSGRFRVYAMSNISAPDYEFIKSTEDTSTWDLFDDVFTSAAARERKPYVGYFKHVIESTGMDPYRTIFIDDKVENVVTARSLGMHGIIFDDFASVSQQLRGLCNDPIAKGMEYLEKNKKNLLTTTSDRELVPEIRENFAQLLILEATGDSRLVDIEASGSSRNHFNFFNGKNQVTAKDFPDDVDTTSIGLTVMPGIDLETKNGAMDEVLTLLSEDGLVQVYFDPLRPRLDPVVCVNALTLFYSNNRGSDLARTLDWCYEVLANRAYIDGTLYYIRPESFLFFMSRLLLVSPEVRARFEPTFKERLIERIGVETDALALAMRILACQAVGIRDVVDCRTLRAMQESDGSWPVCWFYRYPSTGILIGNKGVSTAFALKAVQAVEGA